ncbi:hypothetical protein [Nannocystis pusilla]|uniref:hypothetical protein n=1 Tax=Nannocystis pusilla TaxID=889268 RepID=UPI003BF05D07
MRTLALGAAILCGAACIPFAPYWWIEDARLFGTRMTVVEPGGYSTLLEVPPGQQRASALPLDTVEVEWLFAAPADTEVQPPIWLACTRPGCIEAFYNRGHGLLDCPLPLPFDIPWACRLGEGHKIRFGFAGAFTLELDSAFAGLSLLAIGSRTPEVPSATCVERYQKSPHVGLEQCLIGRDVHIPGPLWAVLPFAPELGELPLEVVTQAPDTHPDIVGFRVSRERGADRIELLVEPEDTVIVEPGEHITVLPLLIGGGVQDYVDVYDPDGPGPEPTELLRGFEQVYLEAYVSAVVDQYDSPSRFDPDADIEWVVSDHPEPLTVFVVARDDRAGVGLARLHFAGKTP